MSTPDRPPARGKYGWEYMTDGKWHLLNSPRINAERARTAAGAYGRAHGYKVITRGAVRGHLWVKFVPKGATS